MRRSTFPSLAVRLGALIFLSTGCDDGTRPSEPTAPPPAPAPVAPPIAPPITSPLAPPPEFPPLSRPGEIYRAPDSLYDFAANYHGSRLASRYVLYDGGTFSLQFSSLNYPFFDYTGRYSTFASGFNFTFDADDRWYATGTLRGDSLIVTYSIVASLSDF